MRIWPLSACILLYCFLQNGHGYERTPHTNGILRGPYLQFATPYSMYVVWRTDERIDPKVRFGTELEKLDRQSTAEAITTRYGTTNKHVSLPAGVVRLHSAPEGCYQYDAQLTNLAPDTLYYYAVFNGERRLTDCSSSYFFRTQPLPGTPKPMRIWVVGDSGTGRPTQFNVQSSMMDWIKAENHPLDFYIHVGDMAYSRGRDVEFQSRFFDMYDATLRNTVCWPAMGNHEGATSKGTNGVGPYYDAYVLPTRGEAGGVPSGTEAYYAFDYGRTHFICLDSHDLDRKPTGTMATWLKADLEQASADWLVAYFHHPPYTKGSHDSDREKQLIEMRRYIMPILEAGGVDLVLTGHSHIYERSMLMDGAYDTPTVSENAILDDGDGDPKGDGPYRKPPGIHANQGTVQIVAGHGGTTLRRKATMPVMKKIIVEHGSVLIDIEGDQLTGRMVNKFGELRDTFSIVKRTNVELARLVAPWQPEPWKAEAGDGKDASAEPPEDYIEVIPKHAEWRYLAGKNPKGGAEWTKKDYDDSDWEVGEAGFGYADNDDRTVLSDMQGKYSVVYIRHDFEIEQADYVADIGLMINFDDAFVAYLNGKEVARVGVKGSGKDAKEIKQHDATGRYAYYPLKDFEKYLKDGTNVLAIEGHNASPNSHDFTLDPFLVVED